MKKVSSYVFILIFVYVIFDFMYDYKEIFRKFGQFTEWVRVNPY